MQSIEQALLHISRKEKTISCILKWAETTNGLIDNQDPIAKDSNSDGEVTWISVPEVKSRVHKWRSEHMAILVGRKTV